MGSDEELEEWLALALAAGGNSADAMSAKEAVRWLVDHADIAHPAVAEMLDADPQGIHAPALLELLPAFGRGEDAGRLERGLRAADDFVADTAGRALARLRGPVGRRVLVRAAGSEVATTAAASALGLGALGPDREVREALHALARHCDPTVRFRALEALDRAGDMDPGSQYTLAQDPDPDIRERFGGPPGV